MTIEVRHLSKSFGAFRAVDDVSFRAPSGELVALLGPSGSGKTSLLRMVAGLEHPDSGSVHIHEDDFTHHSPRDRNVGFVFQHYALFPHMTIFENVAFGLRVRRVPKRETNERVDELLHLVQLHGYGRHYPSQLSGGQRQRVALARALAPSPRLLLLDEPFGSLDAKVRQELRAWLRRLHDEIQTTSLFVTHDQEEAFAVADRVAILHEGRLQQFAPPEEILARPANEFVAGFIDRGHDNSPPVVAAPRLALLPSH